MDLEPQAGLDRDRPFQTEAQAGAVMLVERAERAALRAPSRGPRRCGSGPTSATRDGKVSRKASARVESLAVTRTSIRSTSRASGQDCGVVIVGLGRKSGSGGRQFLDLEVAPLDRVVLTAESDRALAELDALRDVIVFPFRAASAWLPTTRRVTVCQRPGPFIASFRRSTCG